DRRSWPCFTTAAVPTTAAVLTTGPPMTPRRPARGPSGMSGSFLDGGQQRLRRDAAVGDELAARPANRRGERAGPGVLVHELDRHLTREVGLVLGELHHHVVDGPEDVRVGGAHHALPIVAAVRSPSMKATSSASGKKTRLKMK